MYSSCNASRSGDQAPVRANDVNVSVLVGEWPQVSVVNTANANNENKHALTTELRRQPVDDIRRTSRLPTADYHHQNLANERVYVPLRKEVSQRRLQSEIDSPSGLVWIADGIQGPQYQTFRTVLVETHAQVRSAAVGGDTDV